MLVQVMDSDLGTDSLLGYTRIAIKDLFEHKGEWGVN